MSGPNDRDLALGAERPVAGSAPDETARAASARLYADLHAGIITGRMRPGESLSETRVAEQYGISRTPVREVFRRLTEEGFLSVVPQVGTYVAPINLAAVTDDMIDRIAIIGTADECRRRLRAFHDAGVTTPMVHPFLFDEAAMSAVLEGLAPGSQAARPVL